MVLPAEYGYGTTLKGVDIATGPKFGFSNAQTLPVEDFFVVTRHREYDRAAVRHLGGLLRSVRTLELRVGRTTK